MSERIAVLGIDSSLRGLACMLGVEGLPVHEHWATSGTAPDVNARVRRYDELLEPVVELARQHKPRVALIEGYAYSRNDAGAKYIAEFGGILRRELSRHCGVLVEVGTSTLKKHATGKGGGGAYPKGLTDEQRQEQQRARRKAGKGAVAKALLAQYGRTFDNDDLADAYVLLRIGMNLVGMSEPETQAQAQVLKGLRAKAAA